MSAPDADMPAAREYPLGPVAQIPPGEGRNFRVGDVTVAVFRTSAGGLYATQPDCPHRRGPLADGLMGGNVVVCPLHDRAWDLCTGAAVSGVAAGEVDRLRTYPVRLMPDQTFSVLLSDQRETACA